MVDYSRLIDAETWAFIEKTAACYPDDTATQSIADQRQIYNKMCNAFYAGRPDGVTTKDIQHQSVAMRHYRLLNNHPEAVVLYLHGGGFVVGNLDSHDDVCAEIVDQTGLDVVAVDYRLSPEYVHPAAFDDCAVALDWVQQTLRARVILAGDSAGANLAAALAHANRGKVAIAGQVLIYPGLGGEMNSGSYIEHAHAPMLTRAELEFYKEVRSDGPPPTGDPTYAPLQDIDFTGLPPTLAIAAQCDPLADDATNYAALINSSGGQALAINELGMVHGYLRARHSVERARASFARITRAISLIADGHTISEGSLNA